MKNFSEYLEKYDKGESHGGGEWKCRCTNKF